MEQFRIQALKDSLPEIIALSLYQVWLNCNFPPFARLPYGQLWIIAITLFTVPANIYMLAFADQLMAGLRIYVPNDSVATDMLTNILRLFLSCLIITLLTYFWVYNVYQMHWVYYAVWYLFLLLAGVTGYRCAIRINYYK